MSEEILKALTQLFAIISKQDGGVTQSERGFVINYFEQELDRKSVKEYVKLYDEFSEYNTEKSTELTEEEKKKFEKKVVRRLESAKKKAEKAGKAFDEAVERKKIEEKLIERSQKTSAVESVKTLKICKQINKTLTQRQKVIVLFKLLEMLAADNSFTEQRMEIIETVSKVFNIEDEEYRIIENFIESSTSDVMLDNGEFLIFDEEHPPEDSKKKYIESGYLDGEIIFVRVKSVELYFTKYTGDDEIFLNGQLIKKNTVLLFSHGSVFKTPKGAPLYYSDLVNRYNVAGDQTKISFNVKKLEYRFPNGGIGLRNINLAENQGKLVGIMGASGAGKTTLLNVLAGLNTPSGGHVRINNYDLHKDSEQIEGVIGYVAQDDLLIEELTVYQNLYYNAKLCFKDLEEQDLHDKVMGVLTSLGLDGRKDLRVGSVLDKTISGGQRKRLNIALELIREPAVLFVDEPTSGLSSRDSENVIDLLKELSLKGKLIFVVIHQPSSDIYKMFDRMVILDTGGYQVYYGNPIEAVTYFKQATNQIGGIDGQCPTCGNVNVELIFNIIEAKVVDEYGEFTNKRKITPPEWYDLYKKQDPPPVVEEVKGAPPKSLNIPSKVKQATIFTIRDFLAKVSNKQYMSINLLEAPFLALLLAGIVRYKNSQHVEEYVFRYNENIPAFMLICVVIALFMGLTVSAEEIIRDRKIQKREQFLNLSRFSYLSSKVLILFTLSAVQTFSFVVIGNTILEIQDMGITYWSILFSVSCFANILGLNISSTFNSAVTVYIIIPLLLIPQMILSGAIFRFDQLNNAVTTTGKVPLVADIMVSRWAYEALAVEQFKSTPYEKMFFELEMEKSRNDYRSKHWVPELKKVIDQTVDYTKTPSDSIKIEVEGNLTLLRNELKMLEFAALGQEIDKINLDKLLTATNFNENTGKELKAYLDKVGDAFTAAFIQAEGIEEEKRFKVEEVYNMPDNEMRDLYFNEQLSKAVKNAFIETQNKREYLVRHDGRLVQRIDPIFHIPDLITGPLDYRAHFYAPQKHIFGQFFGTLEFNLGMMWFMSFVLFITLYFDVLKKFFGLFSKIKGFSFKR